MARNLHPLYMEYLDDSDVLSVRRDRDTVLDDPDLHPMAPTKLLCSVITSPYSLISPPLRVLPTGFLPRRS